MGFKIGIVGYGDFSRNFVKLFKLHPDVDEIVVADLSEKYREEAEKECGVRTFASYDEMLEKMPELDSIGIFTQRHLHGPMVIKALEAGKHVYSAVPVGCTIEEIEQIVKLVEEKRLIYMMGETCYYYPCAIYCRDKYKEGAFGPFVYAEAQYYHDIREMYYAFNRTNGAEWRKAAGIPPMYYPTHSISMVFSAINQYATKVSCVGFRDSYPDDIYGEGKNYWDSPFSNETAVFQMSDGGVVRINEFRRCGINKPSTFISSFYGEQGAYENIADVHYFQTVDLPDRNGEKGEMHLERVSDLLMPVSYQGFRDGKIDEVWGSKWSDDKSPVSVAAIVGHAPIHDLSRLPVDLREDWKCTSSHFGSHPFLVDDFCRAVVSGKLPPCNVWESARWMVPGIVAHESAMQGGVLLDIPDFGAAPEDWEMIDMEPKDYYEKSKFDK